MSSTPSYGSKTQLSNSYFLDIVRGQIKGVEIIHKFGHNDVLDTTFTPIAAGGIYRTPTVPTTLEILSSDVNDTLAGTGARKVFIQGIASDWSLQSETVELDGINPVDLDNSYLRVFRMYVEESGVYADAVSGSHVGTLTLRETGGGDTWASIDISSGFALGQTEIGVYTVPLGKVAFIMSVHLQTDALKEVDIIAFKRTDADRTSAPYGAMRIFDQFHGVAGHVDIHPNIPLGPYPACTDIGFLGKVDIAGGGAQVDFEIVLFDE